MLKQRTPRVLRDLHVSRGLLLLALFSSGCGQPVETDTCHSWESLDIDVSQASDPETALATILQGIEEFVDWTGREQTCVEKVEVVSDLGDGVGGRYYSQSKIIRLRDGPAKGAIIHEFCHALDDEEGRVSMSTEGARVLEPYRQQIEGEEAYPTEAMQFSEAFARWCDDGPAIPALVSKLEESCDVNDQVMDVAQFLIDVAFPNTDAGDLGVVEDPYTFEAEAVNIPDTGRDGWEAFNRGVATVTGASGLFLLDTRVAEEVDEGTGVVEEILRVDHDSGHVVERLALDEHGFGYYGGNPTYEIHKLIGSDTAPLLLGIAGDVVGLAWRVESDPLRLEPIDWDLSVEDSIPGGFESDGELLARWGHSGPIWLTDLASGSQVHVAEGESVNFNPDQALSFSADERGGLAVYGATLGMALVAMDFAGEVAWSKELPFSVTRVGAPVRASDDVVLVSPNLTDHVSVTLKYDASADTWALPSGECWALQYHWVPWDRRLFQALISEAEDGSSSLVLYEGGL